MEVIVILIIFAIFAKLYDARDADQKAEAIHRHRTGLTPGEKAACLDTHEFSGEVCIDCGESRGGVRKFGWPCKADLSSLAGRLRGGGWGRDEQDAFKAALREYREHRSTMRSGGQASSSKRRSKRAGQGNRTDGRRSAGRDETSVALEVLGLNGDETDAEIKQAWRDLCRVWHPDRFGQDERLRAKASAKLAEINDAYDKVASRQS